MACALDMRQLTLNPRTWPDKETAVMISEIDTNLDASLIDCLVDVEAARKNSKLFDDFALKYIEKVGQLTIGQRQQYRRFLEQLLSDANEKGLSVKTVGVSSERLYLKVGLHYGGTRYTPKSPITLMRLEVCISTCCVRLTYLGYNNGTIYLENWRQSPKSVCVQHGMSPRLSGVGNRILWHEAKDFNFDLKWFTGWMKKGQQRLTEFEQRGRAIDKEQRIRDIKAERTIGRLTHIKDMIETRIPGLHVSVEKNDDHLFYLELYNVFFISATGYVTRGLYLPAAAYSRFKGTDKILNSIGFRYDDLVAQNPAEIPFYSLKQYIDIDHKNLFSAHMKIYVNMLDEEQCEVNLPANAEIAENCRLKQQMTMPFDKIEGYVSAWLNYEKMRYEALLAYEARLAEIDKMVDV